MPQHKGGKKNRKHDRNRKWCQSYKLGQRRMSNKVRRLQRHLLRQPDNAAEEQLRNLQLCLGLR